MKQEKACGVIPFLIKNGDIFIALIKQTNNIIGFPKGHVEKNEKEIETALRECKEETNIDVDLVSGFKEKISYYMAEYDSQKDVIFFLGKIKNTDFKPQEKEVSEVMLKKSSDALELLTYNDTKELLQKALKYISDNNLN